VVYLASAVLLGAYFIYWNVRLVRDPAREIAWKNFKVSMLYLGVLFTSVIVDMAVRNMG